MELNINKLMNMHKIEIEGYNKVENDFELFFANTNLDGKDRVWLLKLIQKLTDNNLKKQNG